VTQLIARTHKTIETLMFYFDANDQQLPEFIAESKTELKNRIAIHRAGGRKAVAKLSFSRTLRQIALACVKNTQLQSTA
jgi:hypothetical protein